MAQCSCVFVLVTMLVGIVLSKILEGETTLGHKVYTEIETLGKSREPQDEIIKMLLVQSWAKCIDSNRETIKDMLNHDDAHENYEQFFKDYIQEKKAEVPAAVLNYLELRQRDIDNANKEITAANDHIATLEEGIDDAEDKSERQELISVDMEKITGYAHNCLYKALILHEMVRQSYVVNFMPDHDQKKFDITVGDKTKTFNYPPLTYLTKFE